MAQTLVESAKIAASKDEDFKAAIMEMYASASDVLAAVPFENITGNALSFNREQTLPNIAFRGVNEAYTEGTGKVSKITESLTIAGGDIDVDKFIVKTGGPDQRTTQEAMKIKAMSLSITQAIIKGDVLTNPKQFDGLQARIGTSAQRIAAGSTAGGDALSLAKLDELIDTCDEPTHLIMNKTMRRRLSAAARNASVGGYITYDQDSFGRRVMRYNDLPILVADVDNTFSQILQFNEACPGGGGSTGSSIYAVSLLDDGLVGLQNGDMEVQDLGELQSAPVYRTRIEWYITLAVYRERSIARLWGVANAAVVA